MPTHGLRAEQTTARVPGKGRDMPENVTDNANQEERTFTQAEVDAIVGDRLKRDRAKYSDYEEVKAKAAQYDELQEAAKTDLQKAEERASKAEAELERIRKRDEVAKLKADVAREYGISPDVLRGETEEDITAHAESLKAYFKGYPTTNDRGEAHHNTKRTPADAFADALKL